MFRVFIGHDSREDEAFRVCKFSIERRSSVPLAIQPIRLSDVRAAELYWRADDPLASTEFTYSRFLTPLLADYRGWALFCDCDFLWLEDVSELLALADATKVVQCVQHDYRPQEHLKMDGKVQSVYPRKNWSSLMLFNCEHPGARKLTAELVNSETGSYLHQMRWAEDRFIGALPLGWNWLEGWNEAPSGGLPQAVHFTRGGPWFPSWQSVAFADLWLEEKRAMEEMATGAASSGAS